MELSLVWTPDWGSSAWGAQPESCPHNENMKTCLFIVAIEFCLFDCLFLGGLLVDCCLIRELLGHELGVLRKGGGQRPFHLPWLGWWPLPPLQTDLIRANDKPEHKLIKKKKHYKKKINVCTHPTLRWFTSPSNYAKTNGARDGKQTNKKSLWKCIC